jgi:cytochrome P450
MIAARGAESMSTDIQVDFFDPQVNECPYPAYRVLRDEAPVWKDPKTGMYVVTRYDDVRVVLTDTDRFAAQRRGERSSVRTIPSMRAARRRPRRASTG